METKENVIDKNKVMDIATPYLKIMEGRCFEIGKLYDTAAITFIGFMIAASSLIIVSDNANFNTRAILVGSIFSFIIGWVIYLEMYKYKQDRISKQIDEYVDFSNTEEEDKINEKYKSLIAGPKEKNKEDFYFRISTIFWYLGVGLFIVGALCFTFLLK